MALMPIAFAGSQAGARSAPGRPVPAAPGAASALDTVPCRSLADLRLARPTFLRSLHVEFDLAGLQATLCPILLDDGLAALLVLPEYACSDAADEVERLLAARGYTLARPARTPATAALLLTLARGAAVQDAVARDPRAPAGLEADAPAQAGSSSLLMLFRDIVAQALRLNASDIHLRVRHGADAGEIRCTIDGLYVTVPTLPQLPARMLHDMLAVVWMDVRGGNGAVFDPASEQQGQLRCDVAGESVLLRWASLATDAGPAVCLRVIRQAPDRLPRLRRLGFLPAQYRQIRQACRVDGGAVVVAGQVGAGKSTTLAAMLAALPDTRKLITLEDPVETPIPGALQNTVVRELAPAPRDDAARHPFDTKLKTLKRCALHDFYLGEVRDHETGRAFADMASAGINVYTSTHAGALHAIADRLSSDFIGVSADLLAAPGVLKLLVCQALAPRLCRACALPWHPTHAGRAWLTLWRWCRRRHPSRVRRVRRRNPQGCDRCAPGRPAALWGYLGRIVVADVCGGEGLAHGSGGVHPLPLAGAALARIARGDIDPAWFADQAGGIDALWRSWRLARRHDLSASARRRPGAALGQASP